MMNGAAHRAVGGLEVAVESAGVAGYSDTDPGLLAPGPLQKVQRYRLH